MSETPTTNPYSDQIYRNMRSKETEELISIWQENDRNAWTEDAFNAVHDILIERLGKLPDPEPSEVNTKTPEEMVEETENPGDKRLYRIADASSYLSWIILVVAIIYSSLTVINRFFQTPPISIDSFQSIYSLILLILLEIDNILYAVFAFLILQSIYEIIYLLMDIRDIANQKNGDQHANTPIDAD